VGVTGAGFALYYGLQGAGVDPIWAGNIVQLTFVLGLTVAWVGSYVSRVMNKDMTYVKQLQGLRGCRDGQATGGAAGGGAREDDGGDQTSRRRTG
jgi:hypothetical protein